MSAKTLVTAPTANLHPDLNVDSTEEAAKKLHRLLLDLSKESAEKESASAFRKTADFFRETYFGLTEKKIKSKIVECLEDYFDGETYTALEIENIAEQTGITEENLLPVINRMVKAKVLICGRRRRWNELGEHYNPLYKLNR